MKRFSARALCTLFWLGYKGATIQEQAARQQRSKSWQHRPGGGLTVPAEPEKSEQAALGLRRVPRTARVVPLKVKCVCDSLSS